MMPPLSMIARAVRKYIHAKYLIQRDTTQSKTVILVSGVQRSGTNMIMDFYDRSLETTVFHETDKRVYEFLSLAHVAGGEAEDCHIVVSYCRPENSARGT